MSERRVSLVAGEGLYERYKDALKRGHVAALQGRLDEALDAYAEASRIAPERSTPHTAAGTALLRRKRPADALAYYEAAVAARAARRGGAAGAGPGARRARPANRGGRGVRRARRAAREDRQARGRGRRRTACPGAGRGPGAAAHAGAADRAAPGVRHRRVGPGRARAGAARPRGTRGRAAGEGALAGGSGGDGRGRGGDGRAGARRAASAAAATKPADIPWPEAELGGWQPRRSPRPGRGGRRRGGRGA